MITGDRLYESVDDDGKGPAYRSIHKVSIRKKHLKLGDKDALCFVHRYRDEPVLMYCEAGRPSELSGAVWSREHGGQDFQCVAGCGARVPKRLPTYQN